MAPTYTENLVAKRTEYTRLGDALRQKAADEDRELTDDERAKIEEFRAECERLDKDIELFGSVDADAAKFAESVAVRQAAANTTRATLRRAVENTEHTGAENAGAVQVHERARTVGQAFVDSDAFRNYQGRGGRGSSDAVEFEDFLGVEQRAAITTPDLAGLIPEHTTFAPVGRTYTTPLLNAIGRERVSSGTVTWIAWDPENPLAAVVPEGEPKPEAALAPHEEALNLDTFAHWKAISRQALEDYPRIRSIVEGKLRGGLADALQAGAVAALTAASGDIPEVGGEDLLSAIRLGVASVQGYGFTPRTVLVNPADYAHLDLAAAAASNSGPTAFGTFWGLAPLPEPAVPVGTAYVGDLQTAVTWFDRGTASVYMTDSHSDFFTRNLLVILAETRAAFAVTDPLALAKVSATPASEPEPAAVAAKASK